MALHYRIVGNFRAKKKFANWWKYDFRAENFGELLTRAMLKDTTPPNFMEKAFANSHKTEIRESFLPQKFPVIQ